MKNATVAGATNAQSMQNERAAAGATSCAAKNDGASASAEETITVTFQTGQGLSVSSVAYAACQAGNDAPASGSTESSSSGSQASITSVSATVVCNGVTTKNMESSTIYRIDVDGVYCKKMGFAGAVTGQRNTETEAEC